LVISLTASITGWNSPNGPTRLGPSRSCISAEARRSTHTMIGTAVSSAASTAASLMPMTKSSTTSGTSTATGSPDPAARAR